jgi:hypothetical protein
VHDVGPHLVERREEASPGGERPDPVDTAAHARERARIDEIVVAHLVPMHVDAGRDQPADLVVHGEVLARRHPRRIAVVRDENSHGVALGT